MEQPASPRSRLGGRRAFLARLGQLAGPSLLAVLAGRSRAGQTAGNPSRSSIRYVVAAGESGRFMGWPANHGLWSWEGGREILVGFGEGPWRPSDGHQVGDPQIAGLARSLDGGGSWSRETPDPYVDREGEGEPRPVPQAIRFGHPDLALRVVAGSDGDDDTRMGRFFVSSDRGHQWQGPFLFGQLGADPRLAGLVTTSRTSYLVRGEQGILLLLSARDPRLGPLASRLDKPFAAASFDGGRSFRFLAWVTPWSDPYRAVMPSTVRFPSGRLITVVRRRDPRAGDAKPNWLEAFGSSDGGASWSFLSRVGETGAHNGNPGALTRLRDGRLACAYANRSRRQMLLRLSADRGRHWGPEIVIRSNPFGLDMGYPQIVENPSGELVILYYLATESRPHSYIEAAILPTSP